MKNRYKSHFNERLTQFLSKRYTFPLQQLCLHLVIMIEIIENLFHFLVETLHFNVGDLLSQRLG